MISRATKNWLWFVLSLAACAISWTYTHRVLMPWAYYMDTAHGHHARILGDLYSRWVGTRELLLHGVNPYSPEVSHEIQMGFYGHPIIQNYDQPASVIVDEQRFAYPVYVVFLMAPTLHVEFDTLNAWAPGVLAAFTAFAVWLWLDVLRWRPPPSVTIALILFVLASPQIAQGLRLRQLGLLVAFLLAATAWCTLRGRLWAAGTLLAISTIKPQMVVFSVAFFLLWSLGDWGRRWRLAAGFGITLTVLAGAGALLVPTWPHDFLLGMAAYSKYFPTTSVVRLMLGDRLGWILSLLAMCLLHVLGWRRRKAQEDSPEFLAVLGLFFLATTVLLPLMTPFNQVLLLLPFLTLLRNWEKLSRWGRGFLVAILAWPSIVSLALLVHSPDVNSPGTSPLLPAVPALALPFLILILRFTQRSSNGQRSLTPV